MVVTDSEDSHGGHGPQDPYKGVHGGHGPEDHYKGNHNQGDSGVSEGHGVGRCNGGNVKSFTSEYVQTIVQVQRFDLPRTTSPLDPLEDRGSDILVVDQSSVEGTCPPTHTDWGTAPATGVDTLTSSGCRHY